MAENTGKSNWEGTSDGHTHAHMTVGPHRARCLDCTTWCYPSDLCSCCRETRGINYDADYYRAVLGIYADADCTSTDSLIWRRSGDDIILSAMCSDFFHWGTADAESIQPGDIRLLRSCLTALMLLGAEYYLSEYFAACKRGMRPMRLWLQKCADHDGEKPELRALFEACGPERTKESEG
jgi:hypothetical protein